MSALLDMGLIVIKHGVLTTIEQPLYRAHRICFWLHCNVRRQGYGVFILPPPFGHRVSLRSIIVDR